MKANSNAALYGKGVFTTVAVFDGEPFLWEKHWRRLCDSAKYLEIDLNGYSSDAVLQRLTESLSKSDIRNGRARITFSDESSSRVWTTVGESNITVSIIAAPFGPQITDLKLSVSPHLVNSTSPLAGIKSCNYLEPLMSHDEAKRRGFDEAIRLNERGEVTSACMANIFWLKDSKLFTPSLKTGCLPGTTREYVLENLDCEKVDIGIEALREADDIFLTSAGIGIVQVVEFERKAMRQSPHPISALFPRVA